MTQHIFRRFDEELDQLKTRLIRMGSIVQEQVELTLRSLETMNRDLAKLIIEKDTRVDEMDIKIDKQCMRIFALQQPVAMDLRLIMSALKINNNMERISDLAVNIAERVESLYALPDILSQTKLLRMATYAMEMVVKSFDSFINNDVQLARQVLKMDDEVDLYDRENFRILIDIMTKDSSYIVPCSHLLMVNRNIERLADQATNIAEEVVFVIDAEIIKHQHPDTGTEPKPFSDEDAIFGSA